MYLYQHHEGPPGPVQRNGHAVLDSQDVPERGKERVGLGKALSGGDRNDPLSVPRMSS